MKIDEMRLLLRVAETGSMTLAARQLHLTPAAVSATVKRAEEALGVRLFERTTRAVQLTDEGSVIIEGCEAVIARWEQALEGVRGERSAVEGVVHVSAPADTTRQIVAPVLVALAEAHPRLQVVVHSSDVVHHLHRDAIDMAIRYGAMQDSGLSARKLADWPGILVAAPAYLARCGCPRTPDELGAHRTITYQLSSAPIAAWSLHGPAGAREVPLHNPLCGDGYLARQWAIDGAGITMKSLFDVIDDLVAGRLVRVLPGYTSQPFAIHAVFPSRRYMPARVRALDAALTAAFDARSRRCEAWLREASGADGARE